MTDEYASAEKGMLDAVKKVWPDWKIEEELGNGSYGHVYRAVKEEYNVRSESAVKIISIPADKAEVNEMMTDGMTANETKMYFMHLVNDVVNEIQMMESLKGCANIVAIEDFKVVEKIYEVGFIILIRMELLKPFAEYTGTHELSEKDVAKVGMDICNALNVCAEKNIIHRDIKPENIFVTEYGVFKLGDFGIARQLEDMSSSMSQRGTFNYMAPEIERRTHYDASVDVYSLGLVLYKCLNNNRLPFLDPSKQIYTPKERTQALRLRMQGEDLPRPVNASDEMWAVLQKACAFDPKNRYQTPAKFQKALQSVFEKENTHRKEKNGHTVYATEDGETVRQFGKKRRKTIWVIPALVIFLAACGGLLVPKWIEAETLKKERMAAVYIPKINTIKPLAKEESTATVIRDDSNKESTKKENTAGQYEPADDRPSSFTIASKLNMAKLLVQRHEYQKAIDILEDVKEEYGGMEDQVMIADVDEFISQIQAHWPDSLGYLYDPSNTSGVPLYDTSNNAYTNFISLYGHSGYGMDHTAEVELNGQYDTLVFTLCIDSESASGNDAVPLFSIYLDDILYDSFDLPYDYPNTQFTIDVSGVNKISFVSSPYSTQDEFVTSSLIANGLLYTDWLE